MKLNHGKFKTMFLNSVAMKPLKLVNDWQVSA